MMTRKHFEEIAEIIKDNTMNDTQPIINKDTFIDDLCTLFKQDNSNFSTLRFIDACNERGGK